MEVASIVLAGITASGKLLDGILRAKTAWREFRDNDTTIRNLEEDLQLFEFATSTVNRELLKHEGSQEAEHELDFQRINELLTNAATAVSALHGIIEEITRERSSFQSVREYWRTCRFKLEIDNIRSRINAHTTALQVPVLLLAIKQINRDAPQPHTTTVTRFTTQSLTNIEHRIQRLGDDFHEFAYRNHLTVQDIARHQAHFAAKFISTADAAREALGYQIQDIAIVTIDAQQQTRNDLNQGLQVIQDMVSNLGFDFVNSQLEALDSRVAAIDASIREMQSERSDEPRAGVRHHHSEQSEELIDIARSMTSDIDVTRLSLRGSESGSDDTVRPLRAAFPSNTGSRRSDHVPVQPNNALRPRNSTVRRTERWVHVVREQSQFDPLSRSNSLR